MTIHHYLNLVMPCGLLARLVVCLGLVVAVFLLGVPVLGVWLLCFSAIVQNLDRHGLNHAVERYRSAVSVGQAVGGCSAVSHCH